MSLTHEELWGFESKWNLEIAERGFTAVPNALLEGYTYLGMTPTEFLIFINIDSFRWGADQNPFPSIKTLAKRTGLAERSVTRNITSLEKRMLLERWPRDNSSNENYFGVGIDRLTDFIDWDNCGIPPGPN